MSVRAVQRTNVDAMIERLLALDDMQSHQRLVAEHPAIEWKEVVTVLTDRVRENVHVDTHLAERLADIAIGVAETIDDGLGR